MSLSGDGRGSRAQRMGTYVLVKTLSQLLHSRCMALRTEDAAQCMCNGWAAFFCVSFSMMNKVGSTETVFDDAV